MRHERDALTPWVQVSYLAAVLFILALKSMSSPRTARTGVLIGAIGAALATGAVLQRHQTGQPP